MRWWTGSKGVQSPRGKEERVRKKKGRVCRGGRGKGRDKLMNQGDEIRKY